MSVEGYASPNCSDICLWLHLLIKLPYANHLYHFVLGWPLLFS